MLRRRASDSGLSPSQAPRLELLRRLAQAGDSSGLAPLCVDASMPGACSAIARFSMCPPRMPRPTASPAGAGDGARAADQPLLKYVGAPHREMSSAAVDAEGHGGREIPCGLALSQAAAAGGCPRGRGLGPLWQRVALVGLMRAPNTGIGGSCLGRTVVATHPAVVARDRARTCEHALLGGVWRMHARAQLAGPRIEQGRGRG